MPCVCSDEEPVAGTAVVTEGTGIGSLALVSWILEEPASLIPELGILLAAGGVHVAGGAFVPGYWAGGAP